MATRKVIKRGRTRKSLFGFTKYGYNGNESGLTDTRTGVSPRKRMSFLKNALVKTHDTAINRWAGSDPETKRNMVIDFISGYPGDHKSRETLFSRYFPRGAGDPDFTKFENDIFNGYEAGKLLENPEKYSETSKSSAAKRGFWIHLAKDSGWDFYGTDEFGNGINSADREIKVRAAKETWAVPSKNFRIKEGLYNTVLGDINKNFYTTKKKFGKQDLKALRTYTGKTTIDSNEVPDIIERIKNDREGFVDSLKADVATRNITPNEAANVYKKISGVPIAKREFEIGPYKPKSDLQMSESRLNNVKSLSSMLGMNPAQWKNQALPKAIEAKIAKDPELNGMELLDALDIVKARGIDYTELINQQPAGKSLNINAHVKKAHGIGIDIHGVPSNLKGTIKGAKKKSSLFSTGKKRTGMGGARITSGSGRSYTSGGQRADTLSSGYDIKYVDGKPVRVKKKGQMSKWTEKLKAKTIGKIAPKPSQRASTFEKQFKGVYHEKKLQEGKVLMEKTRGPWGWIQRRLKASEARKYAIDPKYRTKKNVEWEYEEGIQSARLLKAMSEKERMKRAATSKWYGPIYNISKWTKWILATVIVIAILFLPIGLFHVVGWALAVGIIALVQFIIWIFMEIWLMIAQALVSIVGLIGQIFIGAINWVGQTAAGWMGQPYKPFEYQTISNMLMFERDANFNWIVYSYTDPSTGKVELLRWGALNLAPPSFLNLQAFMPAKFNTEVIIGYIVPPLQAFFHWLYEPIALRYTAWIGDPATPWYYPGLVIGIPIILTIVALYFIYRYVQMSYLRA